MTSSDDAAQALRLAAELQVCRNTLAQLQQELQTARLQADAARALLQNLSVHVPGVIYQFQLFPDGRSCFPFASHGMESIYEIDAAQVEQDAKPVFARLHPNDLERVAQSIQASAADLTPWVCEYRVVLPRQGDRWLGGVASPQRLADGSTLWHGFISDITDHKLAEKAQLDFNRDFGSFLDQTSDFVYFKNHEGRIRFCSQSLADVFGYAKWRDMLGKLDRDLFPQSAADNYVKDEAKVFIEGKPLLNRVNVYQDKHGKTGFVQTSRWPLFNEQGEVESIFGIGHDVTESRQAQENIQLAANVFTHAREGIVITDAKGLIVDVNEAFCRITGYCRDEILGANPRILNSGRQDADFYAAMWRAIVQTGHWSGEIWNRRKNGEVYAEILTISAVRDEEARVKNYVALFTDITPMKEHQQQLEHIAHFDLLTGLPNRLLFADRLGQAMRMSERRQRSLSVIYLDLDGFKAVNDTYGHNTGDTLLVILAQRMKLALREGDSLARFGGDEFVAVLVDLEHPHDCVPVLERLLTAAAEPVELECNGAQITLRVSASIGATIYPKDGADADLLMRHADQAMYLAKQAGKNRYHLFDVAHDTAVRSHRESLDQIARALKRREFVLYYQPKVDMRSGLVVGAEALIRWQHPLRGLLQPAAFLPGIENHELSVQLGEWVIDTALEQMNRWSAMGLQVPVSVNVGALQLQQHGFVDRLTAILACHPVASHPQLELEILESSALKDIAIVAQVLQACHALEVRVALDDFGTGYSSLTYLKRLPAETLKIDQSFVRDMASDPEDMAIVNGVIGLARAFGRKVIAEGVETAEQSNLLLSLGCDCMQGYGIARPMPADQFPGWMRRWQANPTVHTV
jgi:diguanylate cyclase (GGDEF)-like protein/PAS domain S-box-containing protein